MYAEMIPHKASYETIAPKPFCPQELEDQFKQRSRIPSKNPGLRPRTGLGQPEKVIYPEAFNKGRLTGPVKFFSKLLEIWQLDPEQAYVLLGYETTERDEVRDILSGIKTLRGRDAKDRIVHLYKIRTILYNIFKDEKTENDWLREKQEILGGRSPLDLLLEGSMGNLLRVRQMVELMGGR